MLYLKKLQHCDPLTSINLRTPAVLDTANVCAKAPIDFPPVSYTTACFLPIDTSLLLLLVTSHNYKGSMNR